MLPMAKVVSKVTMTTSYVLFLSGEIQLVSSWKGWVSCTSDKDMTQHHETKVDYLAPINAPVTGIATVQHLLEVSQDTTKDYGKTHTIVTFAHSVAKKSKPTTLCGCEKQT